MGALTDDKSFQRPSSSVLGELLATKVFTVAQESLNRLPVGTEDVYVAIAKMRLMQRPIAVARGTITEQRLEELEARAARAVDRAEPEGWA